MNSTQVAKSIIKAILSQSQSYPWSIQGFGMLRLYLAKELRLHVWTDQHRVENVSDIHTHPWNFRSQVIAGIVHNQRFLTESQIAEGHRDALLDFNKARIVCGENACVVGETQLVKLWPFPVEDYTEGQYYDQKAYEIHRSTPEPGTVTLCRREFLPDTEHADVYWQGDGPWVDAAPRPATPEEVRRITSYALERWF